MCENRIELLDLILGATWMGAIAVPLNTALRGEQLAHQLRNSGARVLAMDTALVEVLGHAEGIDALEQVWALDGVPAELPHGPARAVRDVPPAAPAAPAAPAGPGRHRRDPLHVGHDRPVEGRLLPARPVLLVGRRLVGESSGIGEDDVLYTCLPLFHTNALNAFVQALVAGARFVLGPRFSASRFWQRVVDAGARRSRTCSARWSRSSRRSRRARAETRASRPRRARARRRPPSSTTSSASASASSSSTATA